MTELQAFKKLIAENEVVQDVEARIKAGSANYRDARRLAEAMGRMTTSTYKRLAELNAYDDIEAILRTDFKTMAKTCAKVQKCINQKAGIGLNGIVPDEGDKVEGLMKYIKSVPVIEQAIEPIKTMNRQVVDSTAKYNARYHSDIGIRGYIVRVAAPKCCEFCTDLAGVYDIDDTPPDVYRRHDNCACTVEYKPSSGGRQDVWSKKWL